MNLRPAFRSTRSANHWRARESSSMMRFRMRPQSGILSSTSGTRVAWCIAVCVGVLASATATPTSAMRTQKVGGFFPKPVFLTAPRGDSRLFVLEQRGRVRIVKNGQQVAIPFLDITSRVQFDGTFQGILGIAFHPDYDQNGQFFVNYTVTGGDTRVSRFYVSGNPDRANAQSEQVLLTIDQPSVMHNGGYLAFGPNDGYLYIGMGDGGPESDPDNRGQDPSSLLGKILRIDVDSGVPYSIPPDNPFVGQAEYRPEIWALGLREPWGMTFDRETHDLWIADVGNFAFEEINFQTAGDPGGHNYGWKLMEGMHCFDPPVGCDDGTLTWPIHEYSHSTGCSVNGGYVYRGERIPELPGTYFFSDYCMRKIWSFRYNGQQITEFTDRSAELEPAGADAFNSLAGFGEDGFGELYIIDWHWNEDLGEIYKIVPDPSDVEPVVSTVDALIRDAAPNPFSSSTSIDLSGTSSATTHLEIVSASGRRVWQQTVLVSDGSRGVVWNGTDESGMEAPSGVYYLLARRADRVESRALHLIR